MSETSQPRPDPRTTTSPDVPSSSDPKDIEDGLAESPELTQIEKLQNKVLLLSDVLKKHDAEGAKLTPDMVEELEQHAKERDRLQGEMDSLCKEISDHALKTGRGGPGKSGAKTLHFPVVDKAWELLMTALKALMELFAKGARFLRNLLPNAPENKKGADPSAPKPAPKGKTTIGITLPGGPVAVKPHEEKAAKTATPEEAQESGDQAIKNIAARQKEIKSALDAEAENNNDSAGPAPGSSSKKPK